MDTAVFHVLTLFPEMVLQGLRPGVIGRAWEKGIITLDAVDIRDYTLDRHRKVDDYPYGGGAGMLMQAQPVYDAHRAVTGGRTVRTVYVTPQGVPFTQKIAGELASEKELVFLCGHYEGIDERVLEEIATDFISIGDYVLTGGELAAMVMIDAIARLIPGVLGNDSSAEEESFYNDLLEYPQYSRPEEWHGKKVPGVLLSGDHAKVTQWRLEQARQRTAARRPDLYEKYQAKQLLVKALSRQKRNHIHMMESLSRGWGEILYSDIQPDGVNAAVYDPRCGICMATARGEEWAGMLSEQIPREARQVLVSDPGLRHLLENGQYKVLGEYSQVLYTRRETLPVKYKDIRPLSMEYYARVCSWLRGKGRNADAVEAARLCRENENPDTGEAPGFCEGGSPGSWEAYIRERITAGALYGAFTEDGGLVGVAGMHQDGSLGMPYVEKEYRGRGIGASLESYAVNRMLEKGWTPYGHVTVGNRSCEKLQEKLGFYRAEKTFWRMEKILANES